MKSDIATISTQNYLFPEYVYYKPSSQLLKWIGNKYRFAEKICGLFPIDTNKYYEPFLGTGAVMATYKHNMSIGSDRFKPIIDFWLEVRDNPENVKNWYRSRWNKASQYGFEKIYYEVRSSYNNLPNPADLLYISRSCYGGVMRFRKADGHISTPMGPHNPIKPVTFDKRVDEWYQRIQGVEFINSDYKDIIDLAEPGDLVYCDPPYVDSQTIVYGAQSFDFNELIKKISKAKERDVRIALSIDGTKKSGKHIVNLEIPENLFEVEITIDAGRSMLRRFQKVGQTLEDEIVGERLLLTYNPSSMTI